MRNICRTLLVLLAVQALALAQELTPAEKALLGSLDALERKALYHPRKYGAETIEKFLKAGGVRVRFETTQGKQVAWLIPPTKGEAAERLWIVCGGNGTLALDMELLCREAKLETDAFLLVDYPGYGECAGSPSRHDIWETMSQSVPAAGRKMKIDPVKEREKLCVIGHSLGCAAALLAVEEFRIRKAVLCAPFTSTREMAQAKFGLPAGFPMQHDFDNRVGLRMLDKNRGHAWIFHGDKDGIIPVSMSQTLAKEFKDAVTLTVIAGGGHNDMMSRAKKELFAAMAEARK